MRRRRPRYCVSGWMQGLPYIARHVIEAQVTRETGVENKLFG
jgi:hypothetical protein